MTIEEWWMTYVFTMETVYYIYGWPYYATESYMFKWKLQYDYETSKPLNKTFAEAIDYTIAELAAPKSVAHAFGYVYMLVYYIA